MPQLLGLILVGALAWAGYRWLRSESRRVAEELRKADETLKQREAKKTPTLERDPETGVYTPADE